MISQALDNVGWFLLSGAVETSRLESWRARFESAMPRGGTGTRHAILLPEHFDGLLGFGPVSEAVRHVLGPEHRVFQLSGRDPLPGFGQQGLHTDWLPRAAGDPYSIVTALWLLDPFTPHNGATRVVPRTHLLPGPVPKRWADPAAHHREEKVVEAPAGSVLVFNGHLWHSGTKNASTSFRRVLQCQFSR